MKKRKRVPQQVPIVLCEQTMPHIAEQFRNVRTNIAFVAKGKQIRSIAITSAKSGEGKTTISANLAGVFAKQGKKVLLVDSDLRRPKLHKIFQIEARKGLAEVLANLGDFEECLCTTHISKLDLLTSGGIPPNPSELLGSDTMNNIMNHIYDQYDIVIFDLPPILAVADAQILANQCDAAILVVRSGQTEKMDANKAIKLLKMTDGEFLGVILNDCPNEENHYYISDV
ncbi:CpsD/CapB family tyrosine-protein kinase [Bacillus cereus group sp. BfR-BA-01349]|uniref:CpsD/CapB family tyrosine-protein kinase n=1 Tax=Bacillus cereus group sp. BfR-BA-01349 TaxID=2920312 RepID=UPI001F576BD4